MQAIAYKDAYRRVVNTNMNKDLTKVNEKKLFLSIKYVGLGLQDLLPRMSFTRSRH